MEFSLTFIKEASITYGPKGLLALATLGIGLWAIEIACNIVGKLLKRSQSSASLQPFFIGLLGITLKTLLGINVLGILGFETTSFVALLASAGLAISMSLSGTLSNVAGGIVILNTKNFRPGDLIEAQGHLGRVQEIQIFNTILKTPDNKTVSLANGSLASGTIVNYYKQPTRRIGIEFSVDYENDLTKVKDILNQIVDADSRILKDPKKLIAISNLGDTHVSVRVRVWTKSEDYWDVTYALNEIVKNTFDKEGITCHNCPLNWSK